jgi:hypothetical protein
MSLVKAVFFGAIKQALKKGVVCLQKRSFGSIPAPPQPRQQAPPSGTGQKMVTKGNKVLANGALSGAHEAKEQNAPRAFIYQP